MMGPLTPLTDAEMLELFEVVLAHVRNSIANAHTIYVCNFIEDSCEDYSHSDQLMELWREAGEEHGGNLCNCGWWPDDIYGNGQRILALESIIRKLTP